MPKIKLGVEYQNESVKEKTYYNIKDSLIEHSLTYQPRKDLVLGWNIDLDPRVTHFKTYNFGLTWGCCGNVNVGLKHESDEEEKLLGFGKFLLYFHHAVSARQTVGSEFSLDYKKKHVEARLGVSHQFNDDSTGKFRLNSHGYLDLVFKHRISSVATVGLISAVNLKAAVAEQRSRSIPLGVSIDLKL